MTPSEANQRIFLAKKERCLVWSSQAAFTCGSVTSGENDQSLVHLGGNHLLVQTKDEGSVRPSSAQPETYFSRAVLVCGDLEFDHCNLALPLHSLDACDPPHTSTRIRPLQLLGRLPQSGTTFPPHTSTRIRPLQPIARC